MQGNEDKFAATTSAKNDVANDEISAEAGNNVMERNCCCNQGDNVKSTINSAAKTMTSTVTVTVTVTWYRQKELSLMTITRKS